MFYKFYCPCLRNLSIESKDVINYVTDTTKTHGIPYTVAIFRKPYISLKKIRPSHPPFLCQYSSLVFRGSVSERCVMNVRVFWTCIWKNCWKTKLLHFFIYFRFKIPYVYFSIIVKIHPVIKAISNIYLVILLTLSLKNILRSYTKYKCNVICY